MVLMVHHAVAHIVGDVTLGYGVFRLSKHRTPLPGRTQPRLIRPWLVSARLGCCSATQLSPLLFSCLSCFCLLLLRTSYKRRTRVSGDVLGWWLRRLSAFIVWPWIHPLCCWKDVSICVFSGHTVLCCSGQPRPTCRLTGWSSAQLESSGLCKPAEATKS